MQVWACEIPDPRATSQIIKVLQKVLPSGSREMRGGRSEGGREKGKKRAIVDGDGLCPRDDDDRDDDDDFQDGNDESNDESKVDLSHLKRIRRVAKNSPDEKGRNRSVREACLFPISFIPSLSPSP